MDETKPEMTPERLAEIRDFTSSLNQARRNTDDRALLSTAHEMLNELLAVAPPPVEPMLYMNRTTGEVVAVSDRPADHKMVVHDDGARQRLTGYDFERTFEAAPAGVPMGDLLSEDERKNLSIPERTMLTRKRREMPVLGGPAPAESEADAAKRQAEWEAEEAKRKEEWEVRQAEWKAAHPEEGVN
jgi:hypothetical protein